MTSVLDRGELKDQDPDRNLQRDDHPNWQREDAARATMRDESSLSEEREHVQRSPHQPSKMRFFWIVAAVAVISGTVGAMGNAYFFGRQAGDREAPSSKSTERSSGDSSAGATTGQGATKEATTQATASAPIPGIGTAQEIDDLKQQIRNLNHRIAGLNERVDRLQDLLSLAVPLLQRLAPKN